jgi:hypothetical protein
MRQPDNLPAFCRVYRNGRPLIGYLKSKIKSVTGHHLGPPVITRGGGRKPGGAAGGAAAFPGCAEPAGEYSRKVQQRTRI